MNPFHFLKDPLTACLKFSFIAGNESSSDGPTFALATIPLASYPNSCALAYFAFVPTTTVKSFNLMTSNDFQRSSDLLSPSIKNLGSRFFFRFRSTVFFFQRIIIACVFLISVSFRNIRL